MCGQNFDLVIRNGTVIDGTVAAGRAGDVGVTGDRITAELNPNMFAALCSSI
ncbi:uncharacterized protein METZ01_LOCUS507551 [marine metagenome]|jgi:N-acyl-D-aspartate/D-glutamate deacylase|uniref:Amidohydrolase 3 domain-containing protein n=1 Tax=marine metagenome TaxID=408172 RepID=A0A383ECY5_9ZZZZ